MYPEICKIGPFTIYSYGLMMAIAFIIGSKLASLEARKHNINPDIIFNLAFIALISGIIGARVFYVIENLTFYIKNPLEIIMLQRGGLSWFGGLILGASCSIFYLKNKKLPVYKILDLIAPFIALAQAIGRVGCFLNGCCFGEVFYLIPVQLFSSLLLVFIFIALRLLQESLHKDGEIFFSYLILYSIKRFFLEFWRADSEIIFLGLTLFQIIAIFLFFFSAFKLILLIKNSSLNR